MLKFVNLPGEMPAKRPAEERVQDFDAIYRGYAAQKAQAQAARCSQCGVPFCQVHCPLQNNIPDWLKLTAEGRLEEAYDVSQATNSMPEVCGRICPQDRLCEGNCVIEQSGHGTVTIGAIEAYITDSAWKKGWVKPLKPGRPSGLSVGIVGAGPAGLAAAEALRLQGHEVDIYDRYDRAGGLLIYGIPNFKLEKDIVQRRTKRLAEGGVRFHFGAEVGRTVGLRDLRKRHSAVLLANGVYQARAIKVPGAGLEGIVPALNYLVSANRRGLGDTVADFDSGLLNAHGKHVVVVGGGDTAMDCVRTAVRQGAKSVTCLYRRDRENMPGSRREVAHAMEEGVQFEWLAVPRAYLGDTRVHHVRAQRMRLGLPDTSGRQLPEEDPGEETLLPADMVIEALGFEPEDYPVLFGDKGLKVSNSGTLAIDRRTLMTSLEGVFAAGDNHRGASLVVWALKDGRDAGQTMHRYLMDRVARAHAAE